MDDEALVELARHGDRDAFASIVFRYQDQLYTMALRLLGKPADAADVVQETFLRAYVSLPRLRGASIRGWLFRVAVNAGRDVQRRALRHPAARLEQDDGKVIELPDSSPGPEASALAREQSIAVRDALLALPDDFRAAVVLRDVNDLSYEEMSAALDIPAGTAKSRVARGRAQLASRLRGSEVFGERPSSSDTDSGRADREIDA